MSSSSGVHTTVNLKGFEVVTMVRSLAQKEHSAALSQLASRVSAVVEVKKLITDLIDKLHSEASPEARHKSYCDDELTKASVKKQDLETQVATRSFKLEEAISMSIALDGEVAVACRSRF